MNPSQQHRIFLECTPTADASALRGIPRVVSNILEQAAKSDSNAASTTVPVRYTSGSWASVSLSELLKFPAQSRSKDGGKTSLWACAVPSARLRRLLFPPPGRDGIWKLPRAGRRFARNVIRRVCSRPVHFQSTDSLVLLDPWWRCPPQFWDAVERARSNGVVVGTVIYDLIPLIHPHFVGQSHTERFRSWLLQAAEHSDYFLAISQTVREELRDYLTDQLPHREWKEESFQTFPLGSDFPVSSSGPVRRDLREAFAGGKTYLMVGTLEPRKNQPFLLEVFDKLWEREHDLRLCLVGGVTKSLAAFRRRLAEHPQRGKRLFYFHDLDDRELEYCYQSTAALVYPSIAEGFGLPIVEALQRGRTVLASDTPIHREVGGDFCGYFDLTCHETLAKLISIHDRESGLPDVEPPNSFEAYRWDTSCRELIRVCEEQRQRGSRSEPISRAA